MPVKNKKTKTLKAEHKDTRSERDRFAVVLETLQADFHIFGEKLDFMEEKFEKRFTEIDLKLDKLDFEIIDVKSEISNLKNILVRKADLDRLEHLEKRVSTLEKLVAAR